jgi:hypothetical protein
MEKLPSYRRCGSPPPRCANRVLHGAYHIKGSSHPQHFLSVPIEQGTVLNLVAFVSDRSKEENERVWDGPWVKPVTQEQMLEDFADWDEQPRNLLKVRIADATRLMRKC